MSVRHTAVQWDHGKEGRHWSRCPGQLVGARRDSLPEPVSNALLWWFTTGCVRMVLRRLASVFATVLQGVQASNWSGVRAALGLSSSSKRGQRLG